MSRPTTLGELRASDYTPRTVREEMRDNLVAHLRDGSTIFDGIEGYDETVIPWIYNAILAGHDIVFLGERGQAKSRIMRRLARLLDEWLPVVEGCEINDDPFAPLCLRCRNLLDELGDELPVAWMGREQRFSEKLATPDISVADLIGEVDPIRVAEGRYLADELTIHYGLIPRTHRGLFAINELPDLAERIQVALLNLLEERDIQIRGYKVRLPIDIALVASANPEDYTNRGRIITPLKDRFGAQVRTHYPRSVAQEAAIVVSEAAAAPSGVRVTVPDWMTSIIVEFTHAARRSAQVSQRSGVSVRLSIANWETVVASAVRRAVSLGEPEAVPRISDLSAMAASSLGKIELEALEEGRELDVLEKLQRLAVQAVFKRVLAGEVFPDLLMAFDSGGLQVEASVEMASNDFCRQFGELKGLASALSKLEAGESPATTAAALEFICEGLHLAKRINKTASAVGASYGP